MGRAGELLFGFIGVAPLYNISLLGINELFMKCLQSKTPITVNKDYMLITK